MLTFFFRHLTVQRSRGVGARRVKVATDGKISWISLPLEFRVPPQPLMLIRPTAVASERASP